MNDKEKVIYRLNDDISFRKCDLYDCCDSTHGDCTNFGTREENWHTYYYCNQEGIHLHCSKHKEIELNLIKSDDYYSKPKLTCPKCKNEIEIESLHNLISDCLKMLNIEMFKDAKFIRLDDWYVPEVKQKQDVKSDYFITTNVKTDKDGDTIIVLYVGHKGEKEKVQFFIKPEKCQLTSDHKDLDPSKILSKIEITLKDRTLSQKYDD